jgi:hypothetical protein
MTAIVGGCRTNKPSRRISHPLPAHKLLIVSAACYQYSPVSVALGLRMPARICKPPDKYSRIPFAVQQEHSKNQYYNQYYPDVTPPLAPFPPSGYKWIPSGMTPLKTI